MSAKRDKILDAWFRDLAAFAVSFDLQDKDLNRVQLVPTGPQRTLFDTTDAHRFTQLLKGRQIFATTALLIRGLRDCMRPGFQVNVAVHNDQTAVKIGQFCDQLYRGNPLLRDLMPITRHREHRIIFENESQIQFGTANSEFWRGSKTHLAICTEAPFYDDLGGTLASLAQSVPATGRIVLEGTANGQNDYYQMWKDPTSRYFKLFLSWIDHPEYSANHPSYDGLREIPSNLTELEINYLRKSRLPLDRAIWAIDKIRSLPVNKRHLFEQEYPLTAEDAFILSGDKFIKQSIPVPPSVAGPILDGVLRLEDYDPKCQYAAGVDTASGSANGDALALVILNLTKRRVAATVELRIHPSLFCIVAHRLLEQFGMPVTVVEINFGTVVMDELRRMGVPQYFRVVEAGLSEEVRDRHGWVTTTQSRPTLYGGIFTATQGIEPYTIGCPRLVTQLNALAYDKGGKPAAPTGQHDDIAVAFGLALQGCDQAHPPNGEIMDIPPHAPRSVEEELDFIAKYGFEAVRSFSARDNDTAEFMA